MEIKNFKSFNEALTRKRRDITSLKKTDVLLSIIDNDGIIFLMYDTITKKPLACISASRYKKDHFVIGGAYSVGGYGVFLYESVMTYIHPNFISMSRDGSTSDDALNVYRKFLKREDVYHEHFDSDDITHKQEDLPAGGFYSEKELKEIFELEATRFSYNYGKSKLDTLIEIGKKYAEEHGLNDDEIEYLCWDLE